MGEIELTLMLSLRCEGGEQIKHHRLASSELLLDLGAPGRQKPWRHHRPLENYKLASGKIQMGS